MSIGFIDSGIGGLTTLCDCIKAYPHNDYVYIADTLYAPYGSKSKEFLTDRANALIDKLKRLGAKAVVFACNSCSSATAHTHMNGIPVIRVLPHPEEVLKQTKGKALLLATPVTINSKVVKDVSHERLTKAANDCLAMMIEECAPDFFRLKRYIKELLAPYSDYEAVIAGCTHYIYLIGIIKELFPQFKVCHSNGETVEKLKEFSQEKGQGRVDIHITGKGDKEKYYGIIDSLLSV
ncbi:MAG: glutamate racemase [Christensenellales bacterium]|nr:hypothetical protein [Clostridiales bacterium]